MGPRCSRPVLDGSGVLVRAFFALLRAATGLCCAGRFEDATPRPRDAVLVCPASGSGGCEAPANVAVVAFSSLSSSSRALLPVSDATELSLDDRRGFIPLVGVDL
ncbi:hypothetical protein PF005_g11556 [Phytophthora fragariae]|uniref:Secreted protein n=2 Tax=Phytophthora TaxID=4783 RepID=A0A6A3LSF6_9STRA|nr:hypothetical protein PF009_g12716 [Phytophthora fragariae]KAE9342841.1 hypothetical protein PR003_g9268 [Phytophthora rubi]KAE9019214.1 hypothetical protein PF011_g5928 [Phytophthora fragariae]KAE9144369.1 hypothetical protein PF006_g10686 [Phytophthora fragariae]KAE9210134.1 hypothetical protein PF005_g11556 [Phytophthora fragariae]